MKFESEPRELAATPHDRMLVIQRAECMNDTNMAMNLVFQVVPLRPMLPA